MTDLELSHGLAGSPRTITAYVQAPTTEKRALTAEETTPNGRPKSRGDRLPLPETIEVRLWIDEGTLEASATLAYTIIAEAETATTLTWHEGFAPVYPLSRARLRQEGPAIELTLWLPRKDAAFVTIGDGTSYDGVSLETGL